MYHAHYLTLCVQLPPPMSKWPHTSGHDFVPINPLPCQSIRELVPELTTKRLRPQDSPPHVYNPMRTSPDEADVLQRRNVLCNPLCTLCITCITCTVHWIRVLTMSYVYVLRVPSVPSMLRVLLTCITCIMSITCITCITCITSTIIFWKISYLKNSYFLLLFIEIYHKYL